MFRRRIAARRELVCSRAGTRRDLATSLILIRATKQSLACLSISGQLPISCAANYATGVIGKWHQGFSPKHHPLARGFSEYFGFLVGGHNFILHKDAEPRFGSAHSHDMIYRGQELQKLDGYTTDLFTDEALAFIDRHAKTPWLLYLAYNAVHTPLEILQKYGDRVPAAVTDPERAAICRS